MKWRSLSESGAYSDMRPLREIFAERKEAIAKYVPQDVQAVHIRAVAELKAMGLATRSLKVGDKSPSFELPDHNGKLVSSSNLLSAGRLVLMFIRGRWCPFCVAQMEAMNFIAPEIAAAKALLVAVSPQTEKQAFFMRDQHKLTFPILVDAQNSRVFIAVPSSTCRTSTVIPAGNYPFLPYLFSTATARSCSHPLTKTIRIDPSRWRFCQPWSVFSANSVRRTQSRSSRTKSAHDDR